MAEEGVAEEPPSWAPGASSSRIFSATGREVTSPRLTVSRWGPGSARAPSRPQSWLEARPDQRYTAVSSSCGYSTRWASAGSAWQMRVEKTSSPSAVRIVNSCRAVPTSVRHGVEERFVMPRRSSASSPRWYSDRSAEAVIRRSEGWHSAASSRATVGEAEPDSASVAGAGDGECTGVGAAEGSASSEEKAPIPARTSATTAHPTRSRSTRASRAATSRRRR